VSLESAATATLKQERTVMTETTAVTTDVTLSAKSKVATNAQATPRSVARTLAETANSTLENSATTEMLLVAMVAQPTVSSNKATAAHLPPWADPHIV
jgi:hypothetical protein